MLLRFQNPVFQLSSKFLGFSCDTSKHVFGAFPVWFNMVHESVSQRSNRGHHIRSTWQWHKTTWTPSIRVLPKPSSLSGPIFQSDTSATTYAIITSHIHIPLLVFALPRVRASTTGRRDPSTCTAFLQKNTPHGASFDPSVVSFVDDASACSQATRRRWSPLYDAMRGGDGDAGSAAWDQLSRARNI